MSTINFPTSPSVNDTYTFNGVTWTWNGSGWQGNNGIPWGTPGAIGSTTPNTGAFTTLSASGVATFSAGTVTAPAITTTGDTNNGIYFPAADNLAITTAGSERLRVDSSGNVGIGTSSPSQQFVVSRASASNTGGSFAEISNYTTSSTYANHEVGVTCFNPDGYGGVFFARYARGTNASKSAVQNGDYVGGFVVQGWNGTGWASVAQIDGFSAGGSNGYMDFKTGNVQRVRIDSSGNVIVNTAAVATTATAGFIWIPSCAGAPTGSPTAPYTNAAALVVDTTNERLYVRVGSTWKYATLA